MHEIDKRIALLRLLLADIEGRSGQQEEILAQYRQQITRIVEATVAQAGDVGQALAAMAEVQERMAGTEGAAGHLGQLRQRARRELEALLLTKRVAEAQAQLAELESQRQELTTQLAGLGETAAGAAAPGNPTPDALEAQALHALNNQVSEEIAQLRRLISEASQRAARSVSAGN